MAVKSSSEQAFFAYVSTSYTYTSVVSSCVSYFNSGYFGGYWWGRKMLQTRGRSYNYYNIIPYNATPSILAFPRAHECFNLFCLSHLQQDPCQSVQGKSLRFSNIEGGYHVALHSGRESFCRINAHQRRQELPVFPQDDCVLLVFQKI